MPCTWLNWPYKPKWLVLVAPYVVGCVKGGEYMRKLSKDFFDQDQVLLVGYSQKEESYSHIVYKELISHGIRVIPFNPNQEGSYDVAVFHDYEAIRPFPRTAIVLTPSETVKEVVPQLLKYDLDRILVRNRNALDENLIHMCLSKEVDLAYGCPLMAISGGIHRFHAFLAGVK